MTFARCTLLAIAFIALPTAILAREPGSQPAVAPMTPLARQAPGTAPASGKPLASPAAVAEVRLNGKPIVIHYNTPSMRGRVIMGGLVPYDKVWRTGANPATSFVTAGSLKIGDLSVPAGSYTLYTLPEEPGKPWKLIINKQTGQWGTIYKQDMDLGRTPMKFATLRTPQEVMSISFEKTTKISTQLHVKWETTDEWVKIEAAKNAGATRQ